MERVPLDDLHDFTTAVHAFVAEARRPHPDTRVLQERELELHSHLIRAAGNRAFVLLWNSLRYIYEHIAPLLEIVVADPQRLARCYERTAAALAEGNRAEASDAIASVFTMAGSQQHNEQKGDS